MGICIVKDKIYLEHGVDPYHPENPNRLRRIYGMLEDLKATGITYIKPRMATHEEIGLNHDMNYIDEIASTKGKEKRLDPDTAASPKSYEASCMAVGGVLELADTIMEGKTDAGFALIRPPGHHAESDRAMGFCIFNNVAVCARYLEKKYRLNRILIVDFDLHHGNGTQHSFYSDPEILYFSTHQYPYYPGTGHYTEVGEGKGKGYTINVPLSYGMGDEDFTYIFDNLLVPVADNYKPEFLLVSAGFDTHINDPLGGMRVTEEGFAAMTRILLGIAKSHCDGRALFTLEGGYSLDGLTNSVKAVILEMIGEPAYPVKDDTFPSKQVVEIVKTVKGALKNYWTGL